MESPFPVGVDGYFYPVQLRSVLETGALEYPASQLSFYLMAPLAALTDPITGAKLGAALFGALIALPAYGIGAHLGRSRGAGLLAAVLATTSAGSAFLTIEFVKNGIGLTVALTALWLILHAIESPSRTRIAGAIAGVIAALLAHKMAAAIVVVVAIPAILAATTARGRLRGRRLLYVLGALVLAGGGLLVLGGLFPQRFLSASDAHLVEHLFGATAHWDAPALVTPRTTLEMGHEAALGGVLAGLAALTLSRKLRKRLERHGVPFAAKPSDAERAAAWAIIALALAIALPWLAIEDPQGLGFRVRIVAFVPMALCAAIASRALYGPIALGLRAARRKLAPRLVHELVLAGIAVMIALAMPTERTEGEIITHPALVSAALALRGRIPAGDTVIVPERHIAFMLAWYANVDVRTVPGPIPRAHRWRVMPLAFIGAGSPLDSALMFARGQPELAPPIGLHPRHPNGLVLVAEPTWDWLLAHMPPDARAYFESWPAI